MEIIDNTDEVLELASEAGHVLLQNGAEISRVEDTMARIASHFGVESGNFFVLSNGISPPALKVGMPRWSSFQSAPYSFPR